MRHPLARATLAVVLVTTGCGADDTGSTATDPAATVRPAPADELGTHDGRVCPVRLPGTGDEAFGTSDPAGTAPTLAGPDRAWVCSYGLRGGPQGAAWTREDRPQPVAADRLPALTTELEALAPADPARACTEEMGPRWMLVLATGDDLTGVVVDGYGCRDVRLTDEPFTTPPGGASAPGVVRGVLSAPEGLVTALASGGLSDR